MVERIYIAGPMAGLPGYNYQAFIDAAEELRGNGWDVVSPVEIAKDFGTPEEIAADIDLMRRVVRAEIEACKMCNAIYLLRGWEYSRGTRCELYTALLYDLEIILQ